MLSTHEADMTKTAPFLALDQAPGTAEYVEALVRTSGDLLSSVHGELTDLLSGLDVQHPLRERLADIGHALQLAGEVNRQMVRHLGVSALRATPARLGTGPGSTGLLALVVESNDGLRGLMGEVIRKQGYRVLEASTAEEAERIASRTPHSLHKLITEVLISGESGVALGSRLRLLQPNLGIVYTVCEAHEAVLPREALGHAIVLRKPFTVAGLSGALEGAEPE